MQVQLEDASGLADRFEALLETKGVSIPAHASTGADMLPLWHVLKKLREGFSGIPDDLRNEYSAGIAVHDLAAKVLAVEGHPNVNSLPIATPISRPITTPLGAQDWAYPRSA